MKSLVTKTVMLLLFAAASMSFSAKPGGEGFEIYVGSKLMVQKFGDGMNDVQSLQLNGAGDEQLYVKYHHCGRQGKNRVITIKDQNNTVLKEFRYEDNKNISSKMMVSIKDLINMKQSGRALKLFYASSELPGGRLLTAINL